MTKQDFISKIELALPKIEKKDIDLISRAYDFAQHAHGGQLRYSGHKYFDEHCVGVAVKVVELEMDTPLICAALLHDTIEDTNVTAEDLQKEFGGEIANLVEGVSKLGKIQYKGNERHAESLRKFFVSVAKDVRVVILKLADRWHNLETLQYVPKEKQKRIALESIMLHAPLASRLGMGMLVSKINDLAFPFAYPNDYKKTKELMDPLLKNCSETIDKMFRGLSTELYKSLDYSPKVDRRIKGIYSTYKKLKNKNWNINEVYDLVALRVLVKNVPDCYQALGAIHAKWTPVPNRVKDYIAVPKMNGYQSLHTSVFSGDGNIVEIQIKTYDMHEFNEFGIASHHFYKNPKNKINQSSFNWLNQLSELHTSNLKPSQYLKKITSDFFSDRLFVFTPKGDVIDLPIGASVLDFAYSLHTDIGQHAIGGRVNGKYVALKTKLKNEDVVEITTSPKSHPSNKWLEWSTTHLALSRIRSYTRKIHL